VNARAGVFPFSIATAIAFASLSTGGPQGLPPASQTAPLVIQVGINLIQMDAVVTDKQGRLVRDLGAADFVLEVDGVRQEISNAAFFEQTPAASAAETSSASPSVGPGPEAPRGRQALSTVVFLVDDLSLSLASMTAAKEALAGFAADWHRFNPRAGLRTTSDSALAFSLFVRQERFAGAVNALRYNVNSAQGSHSTKSVQNDANITSHSLPDADPRASELFRHRLLSLSSTINTLRALPGRKAVVFISEGLSLQGGIESDSDLPLLSLFSDSDIEGALRSVAEVANRASVVLYTVDPRGLAIHEASALDGANVQQVSPMVGARRKAHLANQRTLQHLAEATGGLATVNTNALQTGLTEALLDQSAFYLIGFEPPKRAFSKKSGRPKFHKIRLRVTRPDLRVRTRAGFYGMTDEEMANKVNRAGS
jgi:VWFA-related protein